MMKLADKIKQVLHPHTSRISLIKLDQPAPSLQLAIEQAGLPVEGVIKTEVVSDGISLYLVAIPASQMLDRNALSNALGREVRPASLEEVERNFAGCQRQAIPPLSEVFSKTVIVDTQLDQKDEVYFTVGNLHNFIRMERKAFMSLQNFSLHYHGIARKLVNSKKEQEKESLSSKIRGRIDSFRDMPAIPVVAQELLLLRADMHATASDLANVINHDPSLSAQLVRYVNSPLYNYQGEIRNIKDAITRVLGYEVVLDMALGVALGRALRMPDGGRLGLSNFWQNALFTATLTQSLGRMMEPGRQPSAGMSYLSGMLHNIGFMLLGHMFPAEFKRLNGIATRNPDTPVLRLEENMLGVTHLETGEWLMRAWKMPQEVITVIRQHHNINYDSDYATYVYLTLLADSLQSSYDVARTSSLPTDVMSYLGLSESRVMFTYEKLLAEKTALDALAVQMAA
jgi:HD-like signal output (HDOD) protein/prolyl-tRNA editing enzyme YbaK/EbsC (Cys-tRNA(Pro) deacylase)